MTLAAGPRTAEPVAAGTLDPAQLVFDWITELSEADLIAMRHILDVVAVTTGTNGFSAPLDDAQAAELADKIRHGLHTGLLHQLMVRWGDQLVGIVTLEISSQPARRHVVEIRRAAIPLHLRGRYLRVAWVEVLRKCLAMGWEVAQIDVSEDGPIALWQRMGFRVFGRVEDYARVGTRRLEGVYMTLDVVAAVRAIDQREARGR